MSFASPIVSAKALHVDGAITFWKVGEDAPVFQIRSGLAPLGLANLAPVCRTPLACLRSAVDKLATSLLRQEGIVIVRSLRQRRGYQVFREEKGVPVNNLLPLFSALLVSGQNGTASIDFMPDSSNNLADPESVKYALLKQYEVELELCSSEQITASLVKILTCCFSALDIRMGLGGCYWLPSRHHDAWLKVAEVFRSASAGMWVGFITHAFDDRSLAVVRDALMVDVQRRSERIAERAAESLAAGGSVMENLRAEAAALAARVDSYEKILGEPLHHLREIAEQAAAVEAATILADRAGD